MSTLRLAHRKAQQKVWARQRLRAGRLFVRSWLQADVARQVGVDPRRVSDWYQRWLCACRKPRPCSSSRMLILVKDTAEAVSSAYV
ncbi:hypothetical protein AB0H83_49370, partial [Dactylosporangium sp. NPDC050688]|uniref:hypothetical protein n=1 Tax=Dactylosporangium sp. NPDC050688 TaxID=3157217 RepID=UPI0033C9F267